MTCSGHARTYADAVGFSIRGDDEWLPAPMPSSRLRSASSRRGDRRPYVSRHVTLDTEMLAEWTAGTASR
jgi:hypothetical protein